MSGFGHDPIPGFDEIEAASSGPEIYALSTYGLRLLNGPQAGRLIRLDGSQLLVGRHDQPALTVDIDLTEAELGSPPMISRRHAQFTRDPLDGELRLIDLGSTNGTWLDDVRLAPNVPSEPILLGSVIRFSNLRAAVVDAHSEKPGG